MDSWRKAARVVACLDLILTFIWSEIVIISAYHVDEVACNALKGNSTGTYDECGHYESLLSFFSNFVYGNEKNPNSLMMWKLVAVIIVVASPQVLSSIKLIHAAKSGNTAAEILVKMSDDWRTSSTFLFLDTGIFCSYFIGNYILFGACLVVRLLVDHVISSFKFELEWKSGVKTLLDSNHNTNKGMD